MAEQGNPEAQYCLGLMYLEGKPAIRNQNMAKIWLRKAASQAHKGAQIKLGLWLYFRQEYPEAARWLMAAGRTGDSEAQFRLGEMYASGLGVPQNFAEAARWYRRSAEAGHIPAQLSLGKLYEAGKGVPQDFITAHFWFNVASAAGGSGESSRARVASQMSSEQIARAQELAKNWVPKAAGAPLDDAAASTPSPAAPPNSNPQLLGSGSGFVVDKDGHVLSNYHVIAGCNSVATELEGNAQVLTVVAQDPRNDLALLKLAKPATRFAAIAGGADVQLGGSVVTVGFPLRGILSSVANATIGNVSALAGVMDDTRLFQVTAPIQPGSSGGPILDLGGRVVGMVVSKLDWLRVANAVGSYQKMLALA